MLRLAAPLVLLSTVSLPSAAAQLAQGAPIRTEEFAFEAEGHRLVGLLDRPASREAGATIVLVHGYGKTNVVAEDWHDDLR